MIKKYITEKRSWICLFISTHLLFIFIAYLDASIPFTSLLYIVFLSFIIFTLFLIWRYHKETDFYKTMEEWDDPYDREYMDKAVSPFEKIIEGQITQQTKQYKHDIAQYRIDLEQEKDDLLSWIHEVKTPLTTMKLMIDRVDDGALKAQLMLEWLRIDLLLDKQLHQKRIPFIENDLHIEKIALQPLIHGEIKALRTWCMNKGIGFDLSLETPAVLSDEKWLGFMLRQLLTNAVKYSEASDIFIKSDTIGEQMILEIRDFGRGIAAKDLPRLFDKGFTSTNKSRNQAATGMGLYLVQKIADVLLIQIDVTSSFGEGTTFTLTFPKKNELVHITSM